jgi:hypothetical protein
MKKIWVSLLIGTTLNAYSQQFATTDDGRRIRLNENGTWQIIKPESGSLTDSTAKFFSKPQSSTAYLKSAKNRFGFWYDKSTWKVSKQSSNEAAEFELQMLKGDGYCMFISEKIEIDLENLKEIAIKNAQTEDPSIKIDREENRIINGQKAKFLQMSGEMHGVKFVYLGYYTSNESGTLQFVCFTARNLLKEYEGEFFNLLNGLVVAAH